MTRWMRVALWAVVGLALVFGLGAYNKRIAPGERGGFVMNFPATGAKVGGSSPRALTGQLVVPLDQMGALKRIVQPNVIDVAAHVITNVGDKPLSVRYVLEGADDVDVEWSSRDRSWNPSIRGYDRAIAPGDYVDLDLRFTLPRPLPNKPVLVDAKLVAVDATTGKRLSVLPIFIVGSGSAAPAGACCE